MAEKIIDIKLNSKQAVKELQTLDEEIQSLDISTADLKRQVLDLEAELAGTSKGSKRFKDLQKQIKDARLELKKDSLALSENRKQKTRLNKTTQQLNKKLKKQAKNHNDVSKGITKTIGGTGVLDRATGGLFSSFQGLTQGATGLIRSLGMVRIAMFAIPIVAIVTALGSLVAAFTSSEEGQNKLTKALNQAKAVITNVVSLLTSLGNGITDAFSALISGDVSGALEAVGDTYETVSKKVSTFSEDIKEDIKAAGELSDMVAKADKIDRALLVQRQKDNIKINDLRTKAYNTEKFNNQERIKFLEDAVKIEDNITNKEIEAARLRFEAKKKENDLVAEVRKEDADEQAKLEAKLFELEAKKINRQREVSNQRQMILRKEEKEKQKIKDDAAKAEEEFNEMLREKKLEQEEADALAEEERLKKKKEREEKEIEIEKIKAEAVIRIRDGVLNNAAQGFQLLGQLAGKSKALAAAAIIGENAVGIAKQIISTKAANAAVTAKYALIPGGLAIAQTEKAINNVSLGLGIAASVSATAKALQGLKQGGAPSAASSSGGGREISASTPPDFNVVGASPENQLAQTIGEQQDKPVQAFVVGSEVTSQQALDRNIVDNATLG